MEKRAALSTATAAAAAAAAFASDEYGLFLTHRIELATSTVCLTRLSARCCKQSKAGARCIMVRAEKATGDAFLKVQEARGQ